MKKNNKTKHLSSAVSEDFYQDVIDYCRLHQCSVSSMISEAVRHHISQGVRDMELLEKCERLIDAKLHQSATINIKARRV